MRILFTRFPLESADGGAENQTQWLMEGLKAKGHSVSFLGSCPVILKRAKEAGMKTHALTIGDPPVTKFGAISFLLRKKMMKRKLTEAMQKLIAQNSELKTIFMLSLSEKLLLTEWASQQGMQVFWIEHDRIGPWLQRNPWLSALKKAAQHTTIICVSEVSRKLYLKMGFDPEKVIAIPNGVPLPTLIPNPIPRPSGIHVGTVARLSPEKGIDTLIHSIAVIPEITLTIVGTGKEESYIRTLIAEDTQRMGEERITLLSHVKDLSGFYRSLDIFVLPSSDHDPFGLVAAEAMSFGIATIVTDACGIAGSIKNGEEALVVPAGSPQELADVIRMLLDAEKRATMAERGKDAVRSRLTVKTMIDRYERLIHPNNTTE